LVPYAEQNDFKIEALEEIELYKGLPQLDTALDWKALFQVFE